MSLIRSLRAVSLRPLSSLSAAFALALALAVLAPYSCHAGLSLTDNGGICDISCGPVNAAVAASDTFNFLKVWHSAFGMQTFVWTGVDYQEFNLPCKDDVRSMNVVISVTNDNFAFSMHMDDVVAPQCSKTINGIGGAEVIQGGVKDYRNAADTGYVQSLCDVHASSVDHDGFIVGYGIVNARNLPLIR